MNFNSVNFEEKEKSIKKDTKNIEKIQKENPNRLNSQKIIINTNYEIEKNYSTDCIIPKLANLREIRVKNNLPTSNYSLNLRKKENIFPEEFKKKHSKQNKEKLEEKNKQNSNLNIDSNKKIRNSITEKNENSSNEIFNKSKSIKKASDIYSKLRKSFSEIEENKEIENFFSEENKMYENFVIKKGDFNNLFSKENPEIEKSNKISEEKLIEAIDILWIDFVKFFSYENIFEIENLLEKYNTQEVKFLFNEFNFSSEFFAEKFEIYFKGISKNEEICFDFPIAKKLDSLFFDNNVIKLENNLLKSYSANGDIIIENVKIWIIYIKMIKNIFNLELKKVSEIFNFVLNSTNIDPYIFFDFFIVLLNEFPKEDLINFEDLIIHEDFVELYNKNKELIIETLNKEFCVSSSETVDRENENKENLISNDEGNFTFSGNKKISNNKNQKKLNEESVENTQNNITNNDSEKYSDKNENDKINSFENKNKINNLKIKFPDENNDNNENKENEQSYSAENTFNTPKNSRFTFSNKNPYQNEQIEELNETDEKLKSNNDINKNEIIQIKNSEKYDTNKNINSPNENKSTKKDNKKPSEKNNLNSYDDILKAMDENIENDYQRIDKEFNDEKQISDFLMKKLNDISEENPSTPKKINKRYIVYDVSTHSDNKLSTIKEEDSIEINTENKLKKQIFNFSYKKTEEKIKKNSKNLFENLMKCAKNKTENIEIPLKMKSNNLSNLANSIMSSFENNPEIKCVLEYDVNNSNLKLGDSEEIKNYLYAIVLKEVNEKSFYFYEEIKQKIENNELNLDLICDVCNVKKNIKKFNLENNKNSNSQINTDNNNDSIEEDLKSNKKIVKSANKLNKGNLNLNLSTAKKKINNKNNINNTNIKNIKYSPIKNYTSSFTSENENKTPIKKIKENKIYWKNRLENPFEIKELPRKIFDEQKENSNFFLVDLNFNGDDNFSIFEIKLNEKEAKFNKNLYYYLMMELRPEGINNYISRSNNVNDFHKIFGSLFSLIDNNPELESIVRSLQNEKFN